jgi:hypothetical protein
MTPTIPYVEIVVAKVAGGALQPLQVPSRVARRAKELAPHVVINADDGMTLAVKVLHSFGADEAAETAVTSVICGHAADEFCGALALGLMWVFMGTAMSCKTINPTAGGARAFSLCDTVPTADESDTCAPAATS